jgi:hypothetical protein
VLLLSAHADDESFYLFISFWPGPTGLGPPVTEPNIERSTTEELLTVQPERLLVAWYCPSTSKGAQAKR